MDDGTSLNKEHLEEGRQLCRMYVLKTKSGNHQVPALMLVLGRCSERLQAAVVGGNAVRDTVLLEHVR